MDKIDILLKSIKEIEPSKNFRRNFWEEVDKKEKKFFYYTLLKFAPAIFVIGLLVGIFTIEKNTSEIFIDYGIQSFSDIVFDGGKR